MEVPPLRVQQMEVPKPSVGRFKWSLVGENAGQKDEVVATGTIFVFGHDVSKLAGWEAGQEYWYVTSRGVAVTPQRFVVECLELVTEDRADTMLAGFAPTSAFKAAMVPRAERLGADDAVLSRSSVHGVRRSSDLGVKLASDAAVCLKLEGTTIKNLDWYWSGAAPLSLFPGGAKVGERVELTQIRRGEAGFPQVGWHKCEQAA
jgi:hypothetical protein